MAWKIMDSLTCRADVMHDRLLDDMINLINHAHVTFDQEHAAMHQARIGNWFYEVITQLAKANLYFWVPPRGYSIVGITFWWSGLLPANIVHWEDRDGRLLGITEVLLTPAG